jgi:peptidoglycan/xylan/chitin deacetylase (PgdA/CDA1 family)/protein-tyrosine-phosphatase
MKVIGMKMKIKLIVKKVIVYSWQWLYLHGLFPWLKDKTVVFMLHRMSSPDVIEEGHSPEFLDKALSYLKSEGYNFVSLEKLFDAANGGSGVPKNAIAFTLDDGFKDQAEVAAPIFIKHHCPATVFLITGFIDGGKSPWDSIVKHVFVKTERDEIKFELCGESFHHRFNTDQERYESLVAFRERCKVFPQDKLDDLLNELLISAGMYDTKIPIPIPTTWERARELENHGISFAPHTENHVTLSHSSDELARQEIAGSWVRVKSELANPCPIFAYPTGRQQDFSGRDASLCQELNLKGAVVAEPGYMSIDSTAVTEADRYLVKRMSFPKDILSLIECTSGLEYVKDKVGGLIFNYRHHGNIFFLNLLFNQTKYFLGFYKQYEDIDWRKVNRLVFACMGNICRSAYAEQRAVKLGLKADSFGLRTIAGSLADKTAIKNAAYRSIILDEHRVKVIDDIDIREDDLVVCMEPWQATAFIKNNIRVCQITLLGLHMNPKITTLLDPYRKPDDHFLSCFRKIDEAICNIKNSIQL